MTTLYYVPQYFTTLLNVGGGINNSQTTGIIIQSVAGLDITKPGIACISYTDPLDTSIAEWVTYTSIDGSNELQGVTRGTEGYSAKAHSNLVTVAFPISKSHINNLATALSIGGSATTGVTGTIDDDTMATASATTIPTSESVKAYVDTSQIGKNYIINGNFDVWQRGTTITAQANDTFIDDRWKLKTGADGGTFPTHINRRTALTTGDLPNSYYCHEINVDGAGSGFGNDAYYWHWQHIENGTRLLCGLNKTITVSFWAKSDIANKRLGIYLGQFYGTGGSPSSAENINGTNWTLTTTWTKYTHTFTTNTLVGKTFGTANDDSLVLSFMHLWGSTYQSRAGASSAETFVGSGSIFIAQVKLEIGDKATDFVPLTYEEELRACQRYYRKLQADNIYTGFFSGVCFSTTSAVAIYTCNVTMRIPPVMSFSGVIRVLDGNSNNLTAIAYEGGLNSGQIICTVASGLTAGRGCVITANNNSATYVDFNAEI